jgi:hypothetical protein
MHWPSFIFFITVPSFISVPVRHTERRLGGQRSWSAGIGHYFSSWSSGCLSIKAEAVGRLGVWTLDLAFWASSTTRLLIVKMALLHGCGGRYLGLEHDRKALGSVMARLFREAQRWLYELAALRSSFASVGALLVRRTWTRLYAIRRKPWLCDWRTPSK